MGDDVNGCFKAMGNLKITEHEFLEVFSHTMEHDILSRKVEDLYFAGRPEDIKKKEIDRKFYGYKKED